MLARRLITAAGFFMLLIGLIHFYLPFENLSRGAFEGFSASYANFLIYGSIIAGVFILSSGFISLYVSANYHNRRKRFLFWTIFQSILWLGRGIMEILFPVDINFYGFEYSSMIVLIICVVLFAIFHSSSLLYKKAV